MLNVYFWNKNEKNFQIDPNSDLKGKADLKRTLLEWVIPRS